MDEIEEWKVGWDGSKGERIRVKWMEGRRVRTDLIWL